MATKGSPTGVYTPEGIQAQPGQEVLVEWLSRELARISAAFEIALVREVEFVNVAPSKPREGMVRGADGTNWNPGGGKGVYVYFSGAWNKL